MEFNFFFPDFNEPPFAKEAITKHIVWSIDYMKLPKATIITYRGYRLVDAKIKGKVHKAILVGCNKHTKARYLFVPPEVGYKHITAIIDNERIKFDLELKTDGYTVYKEAGV